MLAIRTIPREAENTNKGFILQKLQTISLFLNEINKDEQDIDFLIAIEYHGDIYMEKNQVVTIGETKDYGSKKFSFSSREVKNTMVYFLDHWLKNNRNPQINFVFFTTTDIAKEKNTKDLKDLHINLPQESIIKLLKAKAYEKEHLIDAAKKIVLEEYRKQYANNNHYPLSSSYYNVISGFTEEDWKTFFDTITWELQGMDIKELEDEIIKQINSVTFITAITPMEIAAKASFIRAELCYEIELRQIKHRSSERFLKRRDIENIFFRAVYQNISEHSYKYLNLDYTEINKKTILFLQDFIDQKYNAISHIGKSPSLLKRRLVRIDNNKRILGNDLQKFARSKESISFGSFDDLLDANTPNFLFGDLGSGKSSTAAQYALIKLTHTPALITIFIPANYFQQHDISTLANTKLAINSFVNGELGLKDRIFDFDILFKTEREVLLIIDGIDELDIRKANKLISSLKKLKTEYLPLIVIATGRPIELKTILPIGWNTLSTTPLDENEILTLLKHEATIRGFDNPEADLDSKTRFNFLKSSPHLALIATNPLIICAIRDNLDAEIADKTLGDILYEVLHKRLTWDDLDNKGTDISEFIDTYPDIYSIEPLTAQIAWKIHTSKTKTISDHQLHLILSKEISTGDNKNQVISQAIKFFKNTLLLETSNMSYTFVSVPLLECACGLYIAAQLQKDISSLKLRNNWRELSFAMAIIRQRGEITEVEQIIAPLIEQYMIWPVEFISETAMILMEIKSELLCQNYFTILEKLAFRPFNLNGYTDTQTANAFAHCIKLADATGFDWFWTNYLDPIHPLIHNHGSTAAMILTQYIAIQGFVVPISQIEKMEGLILPNLAFPSSFNFELLPVIATLTGADLTQKQRYQLLVGNLSHHLLDIPSRKILLEEAKGSLAEVLLALETICALDSTPTADAAKLWFELTIKGPINRAVLTALIRSLKKDNFIEYSLLITAKIGTDDLMAYLKYCVISANKIASQAALYLLLEGSTDFKLLGTSLQKYLEWFDYKNIDTIESIRGFIQSQNAGAIVSMINRIDNKSGKKMSAEIWRTLLPCLKETDTFYSENFLNAVDQIELQILIHYPEIRFALRTLFENKPTYLQALKNVIFGLDNNRRFKSAAVLLAAGHQNDYEVLEIVITGMYSRTNFVEWQTFCLGLNYERSIFEILRKNIDLFTPKARIFTLILLQRNNIRLSPAEKNELVEGLLDLGYFMDRDYNGDNPRYHIILSQAEHLNGLIAKLDSETLEIAYNAADIIQTYHFNRINPNLKPKVQLLYCEKYSRTFFEQSLKIKKELEDSYFAQRLICEAEEFKARHNAYPILALFYQALYGELGFENVILALIQKDISFMKHDFDDVYPWLMDITRYYPESREKIAKAFNDLLKIPMVQQSYSDILPWIILMEDEFNNGDIKIEIDLSRLPPAPHNSEVFVSLFFRKIYNKPLEEIIKNRKLTYQRQQPVFAEISPEYYTEIQTAEFQSLLVDLEGIPDELEFRIECVLINGNIDQGFLDDHEKRGSLASYISTVVKYCRNWKVNTTLYPKSAELGSYAQPSREQTELQIKILNRIYQNLINQADYRQHYINGLVEETMNPENSRYFESFVELMDTSHQFSRDALYSFFDQLDDLPYRLNKYNCPIICHYLAEDIPDANKKDLVKKFNSILKAQKNSFNDQRDSFSCDLLSWILSLAILMQEEKISEESKYGFLRGLRCCFIEDNSLERYRIEKPRYNFPARDLLNSSYPLFIKVKPELIKEILIFGADTNIPTIRSTCRVLIALTN
ncbi:hypothetical protein [Sphingobacterium sp.]|uniref:NACHT domain-containing protein n=1 Tax=Sphingobacterium sp. TaxID=341027 RepID=UPI0031E1552A